MVHIGQISRSRHIRGVALPRVQPIIPTWRKEPFYDPEWRLTLTAGGNWIRNFSSAILARGNRLACADDSGRTYRPVVRNHPDMSGWQTTPPREWTRRPQRGKLVCSARVLKLLITLGFVLDSALARPRRPLYTR